MFTILVVDDNEGMCETLGDIFTSEGFKVKTALSGLEALKLADENKFDILLTDLVMDGMDGVETLKKMKKTSPQTLLFAMTAYRADNRVKEAMKNGARQVFEKPFEIALVVNVFKRSMAE
ncbi:MAG: response regulator [Candidatus Omnitrophica bacterium]|nr:response regulator [Candidatus Omnitrophota bacterium]